MKKLRVGILGATGAVGQRMIELLSDHPWFYVGEVCASDRSAGKSYLEAVNWRMTTPLAPEIAQKVVQSCRPPLAVDVVFSALPKEEAMRIEPEFAAFGLPVISNASAFRMHEHVPLVIPEINPDHTHMILEQQERKRWKGFIVTNPNCASIGVCLPLAVAQRAYGLRTVQVTTMQARSGAGFPGPSAAVIDDNVLPWIGGEEDKLETEPQKILGSIEQAADFSVSAQCNRVNVSDGHLECVSIGLRSKATAIDFISELQNFRPNQMVSSLPSSPSPAIQVFLEEDRPQPKLDRHVGRGMTVTVGRVRDCPVLDLKFVVLSHNTIRGAAGAAILNAELLLAQGFIKRD